MGSTLGRAGFGFGAALAPAFIPGPAGIVIGGAFAIAGGLLFRNKQYDASPPNVQVPTAQPGKPLPFVFGCDVPQDVGVDFFANVRQIEQKESTKGGQNVTTGFQVLCDLGFSVCRGKGTVLKLWREGILVYDIEGAGPIQALSGAPRFYDGGQDQLPDPVEQALFGVDNAPAYIGVVRVTIQDHDISDINRMPIFKAKVARVADPIYPTDTITTPQDLKMSTTSWDGQDFVSISGNKVNFFNIESQATTVDEIHNASFSFPHISWKGVDFDGNLYVGEPGPGLNTRVNRLDAPDYQVGAQSPFRSTGGGHHVWVTHTPLSTFKDQQVLFHVAGWNVNAWRLNQTGFPNNFAIDNLDLESSSGINRNLTGEGAVTRNPLNGDLWVLYSAQNNLSFYAAIFSATTVAFVGGADGSLNYIYEEQVVESGVACYVPQTHEIAFLVRNTVGGGYIYFIDPDTRTLSETMRINQGIEIDPIGRANFYNGPDEQGRIFLNLATTDSRHWLEINLVTRQVLLEYDMENWGLPNMSTNSGQARYDAGRRALWISDINTGNIIVAYLDRQTGTGANLAEVTAELIDETLLESVNDFNGTAVQPIAIRGAVYPDASNNDSAATFLQTLYKFHNARLIDSGWKLKGITRGGSPVFNIESKYLGAAEGRSNAPTLARPRTAPLDLPQRFEIAYRRDVDYQNATQGDPRALDAVVSRDQTTLAYPGVLTDNEAKSGAMQQLDLSYLEAQLYDTTVPPKFLNIEPGDVGTIDDGNEVITVEAVEPSFGANGLVELKTVRIDDSALSRTGVGQPSIIPPPVIVPVLSTTPVILDTPLLIDTLEAATPVIQIGGIQNTDDSRGATIQRSPNGTDSWTDYAVLDASRIIQYGTLRQTLGPGPTATFDRSNLLKISLANGSLASAPSEQALIDDEQINAYIMPTDVGTWQIGQFLNADLQPDGSYNCDTLIRARKDNENDLTTSKGKRIFFPTIDNLLVKSISLSEVGQTYFFRAITNGSNTPGAVVAYTFMGQSKMPYLGVDPNGAQQPNNNWEVDWMSRSRIGPAYGLNAPPIAEAIFEFECDMLDGPQGNPVANATITTTATGNGSVINTDTSENRRQTMTIVEQDQIDWFGSAQSTIHLAIYQMSDTVGRGWPLYVSF